MLLASDTGTVETRDGVLLSVSFTGDFWVVRAMQSSEETEYGEGLREKEEDGEETGRGEPSEEWRVRVEDGQEGDWEEWER